jgi:Ca2+:H+ antiporter
MLKANTAEKKRAAQQASAALLAPSAVADLDLAHGEVLTQKLSTGPAVLLIIAYGLGLLFSLHTHKRAR